MSKYDVSIELKINEDGVSEPFSVTTQKYNDLSYADIIAIQKAVVTGLLALGDAQLEELKKNAK